jgi:hypothetical protein
MAVVGGGWQPHRGRSIGSSPQHEIALKIEWIGVGVGGGVGGSPGGDGGGGG